MPRPTVIPRHYHNEISFIQGLVRKVQVDARVTDTDRNRVYSAVATLTHILTNAGEAKTKTK